MRILRLLGYEMLNITKKHVGQQQDFRNKMSEKAFRKEFQTNFHGI